VGVIKLFGGWSERYMEWSDKCGLWLEILHSKEQHPTLLNMRHVILKTIYVIIFGISVILQRKN